MTLHCANAPQILILSALHVPLSLEDMFLTDGNAPFAKTKGPW